MDFSVEQGCPQCGASISLGESDRFLVCPFCNVSNYIVTQGAARYTLPVARSVYGEAEDLYFVPYIRFRGAVFQVNSKEISQRVVDTTQLGFTDLNFPPSLGLRPQAMKLQRVTDETAGRFLPLTIKVQSILKRAARLSDMDSSSGADMIHRAFIGESLSFIYLPVWQNDGTLIDAVTNTPLSPALPDTLLAERSSPFQPKWQSDFIAALCPQCGWELEGKGDCLVMPCRNCDTAWELTSRGLVKVPWLQGTSQDNTATWLPFWQISAQMPGLNFNICSDYIRVTSREMVGGLKKIEEMMTFVIPAFKVRPKRFLQTARKMTLAQQLFQLGPGRHMTRMYPANLPRNEARQALKVTLASTASLNKKEVYPLLPRIRFTGIAATLLYLPFHDDGHDFIQEQSGVAIGKNVLQMGRVL
ncbi:MAG: hypothetical protein KQH63_20115 [Desulfobulbaceae bacterium]|nr:hypothetical protein [Desulfobulbaceae bacterium]